MHLAKMQLTFNSFFPFEICLKMLYYEDLDFKRDLQQSMIGSTLGLSGGLMPCQAVSI